MSTPVIKNLRLSFSIIIALLAITSIASFLSISLLLEASDLIDKSNHVVRTSDLLLSELKDAETGQRGFLLTGNDKYLAPYQASLKSTDSLLQQSRKLAFGDSMESAKCDLLEKLIIQHQFLLKDGISQRRAGQDTPSKSLDRGKVVMDSIRLTIGTIQFQEKNMLSKSISDKRNLSAWSPFLICIAGIISLVISLFYYEKIRKSILRTISLQEKLKIQNVETGERIAEINHLTNQIAQGNYALRIDHRDNEGLNHLAVSLNSLAEQLQFSFEKLIENDWSQRKLIELNNVMYGVNDVREVSDAVVNYLLEVTSSQAVALYLTSFDELILESVVGGSGLDNRVRVGEGLLGACMATGREIYVNGLSKPKIRLSHAFGEINPERIFILPIKFEGKNIGVMEFVSVYQYDERVRNLLRDCSVSVGMAVGGARSRKRVFDLLLESQNQKEELFVQTEELRSQAEEFLLQAEELKALNDKLVIQQKLEYEARQEAVDLKLKAEKASQTTTNFLAVMSHEIRTPMNGVLGMAGLLAETELTERQKEYVDIINTSGNALIAIINDILDFSKMGSDHMIIEKEEFNLRACLEDVIDIFASKSADQNVDLLLSIETGVPEIIIGDSLRMRQILINLINNALKFTSKGEVVVSVRASDGANAQTLLKFKVTDTGIGIPTERIPDLFKAFTQLDSATTRKYGGTGLGLAISKKLTELMGGNISVESEIGVGTSFSFELPTTRIVRQPKYLLADSLAGRVVYLADDSKTGSDIVAGQLCALGLHVNQVF
ncbi:MAG TPA: ATP-binding protein, partial [Dyadobacter sp.]|nr:ATP-binding protein [Dyadobacter sp.]